MKTAVMICAYNRPQVLNITLSYLCHCTELIMGQVDLHLFQDGGDAATPQDNREVLKENFPNATFHLRHRNLGNWLNMVYSKDELFALGYDNVIMVGEDKIVSPHMLTVMFSLYDWGTRNYDNIGFAHPGSLCSEARAWKVTRLTDVEENGLWMLSYLVPKEVWAKVRVRLNDIIPLWVAGGPLMLNDIREVFKGWAGVAPPIRSGDFPLHGRRWHIHGYATHPEVATGEDAATCIALWSLGYVRLCPLVNRITDQIAPGEHATEAFFTKWGWDKCEVDVFEEDKHIKEWRVRE